MTKQYKHICLCKAVSHSEVISAIKKRDAKYLLDIQNITKVSTGCSRCKSLLLILAEKEIKKIEKIRKRLRINF
ncbi:MAG: (2Fe-2S)-binding protein [Bacteroidales bacterium]